MAGFVTLWIRPLWWNAEGTVSGSWDYCEPLRVVWLKEEKGEKNERVSLSKVGWKKRSQTRQR